MNISDMLILFRETQDVTTLNLMEVDFNLEDLNVMAIEILA